MLSNFFSNKYSFSLILKNNLMNIKHNHLIHKINSKFCSFKMEDAFIAKMKNLGI